MLTRRFRAPVWAWLLALAGVALFGALGLWQLQRGAAKAAYVAQFEHAPEAARPLAADTPPPPALSLVRARADGRWLPQRQLLQDGQAHGGRPGYHVWTPLQLADGGIVLVNRGWIPHAEGADAKRLALPDGEATATGWWRALPEPGLRLAPSACRRAERFPAVVVYPQAGELACLLGEPVVPGLLLLDPLVPGGFVREWSVLGIPPVRHYGYAVTWFALGLTTVILFVSLNLNRHDPLKN